MDSFYDMEGNLISRAILRDMMIDYFKEMLGDEATQITDFNEGSEIRNLLESIAVDLYHMEFITFNSYKMAFLKYAVGQYLDLHGEELGLPRDYGNYAYGKLKFSLPKTLVTPITIPYGTYCVHKDTGSVYKTVEEVTIPIGELSASASASSVGVGKLMNAEPDTITLFQDSPPYTSMTVTNPGRFNGGRDLESDDEYRDRLLNYMRQDTFGSVSYYSALALTIEGLHDIKFTDPPSDKYTATLLVNGDDKPTTDEIMERAISTFTIQDNLVIGHNFYITKPVYINVVLTIRVYVRETVDKIDFYNCLNAVFDGGTFEDNTYLGLCIGEVLPKIVLINAIERMGNVSQVDYILKGEDRVVFDDIVAGENEVLKVDLSKLQIIQELEDDERSWKSHY